MTLTIPPTPVRPASTPPCPYVIQLPPTITKKHATFASEINHKTYSNMIHTPSNTPPNPVPLPAVSASSSHLSNVMLSLSKAGELKKRSEGVGYGWKGSEDGRDERGAVNTAGDNMSGAEKKGDGWRNLRISTGICNVFLQPEKEHYGQKTIKNTINIWQH